MTQSEDSEPDGEPEKLPRRPSKDTEKALGLQVAKLFGVSPRLLVAPPSPPADDSGEEPDGSRPSDGIDPEPEDA